MASYLTNFFAGKEGGRIGFAEGSDDKKLILKIVWPKKFSTEDLILLVRNNETMKYLEN